VTRVTVVANWLTRRVIPLKKQVHPGWEYSDLNDPTRESADCLGRSQLE
jgi:hypothetical protein